VKSEDRAGLLITVTSHLAVIIVLLLSSVSATRRGEESFLIDFSREEAIEREEQRKEEVRREEDLQNAVSERLSKILSSTSPVRNTVVDRSTLKDDRGTDAEELYRDAERLAKELKDGYKSEEKNDDFSVAVPSEKPTASKPSAKSYSGPSVVSYSLPGRKASRLPIPAYRCYGGGEVTVIIVVDNAGNVIDARVQDATSTSDGCLRDFAVRAARLSKFSTDPKAPARQMGDIVYRFIAQ